jgi:hypothetical protein
MRELIDRRSACVQAIVSQRPVTPHIGDRLSGNRMINSAFGEEAMCIMKKPEETKVKIRKLDKAETAVVLCSSSA